MCLAALLWFCVFFFAIHMLLLLFQEDLMFVFHRSIIQHPQSLASSGAPLVQLYHNLLKKHINNFFFFI